MATRGPRTEEPLGIIVVIPLLNPNLSTGGFPNEEVRHGSGCSGRWFDGADGFDRRRGGGHCMQRRRPVLARQSSLRVSPRIRRRYSREQLALGPERALCVARAPRARILAQRRLDPVLPRKTWFLADSRILPRESGCLLFDTFRPAPSRTPRSSHRDRGSSA